jgi:hypothetical protein
MPWIEHGGIKAHFRGEDTPEAREMMAGIMEALSYGAYCDLATREERHPTFQRAYEKAREEMRERADRTGDADRPTAKRREE